MQHMDKHLFIVCHQTPVWEEQYKALLSAWYPVFSHKTEGGLVPLVIPLCHLCGILTISVNFIRHKR